MKLYGRSPYTLVYGRLHVEPLSVLKNTATTEFLKDYETSLKLRGHMRTHRRRPQSSAT